MTVEGERHIEMTWRCSTCANVNLGRFKACQQCGKPKDASEHYEMPADIETAATVTDEALLRMASAGPDWQCAYCSSHQRAASGACGNCGASAIEGSEVPDDPVPETPHRVSWFRKHLRWILAAVLGLFVFGIGYAMWTRRTRSSDGKVTAAQWERTIVVEKFAKRDHEGFKDSMPADAAEVVSVGQKIHHYDQVLDHYDTEHYTVDVPDGYRTESYMDRVSCGQDCSTSPRSCSQSCTSKKNGFASCRQVCTGGNRSCTTRYCSQSRTRQVPKTRSEGRTRQVPKYRQEPRYAEAFHYKAWDWAADRTVATKGTDPALLAWPANGARTSGLAEGEKEREQRRESGSITVTYNDDQKVTFAVHDGTELQRYPLQSTHDIQWDKKSLQIDGQPLVTSGAMPMLGPHVE